MIVKQPYYYSQLFLPNGIPLYSRSEHQPEDTPYKYRCKLRPHKKGQLRMIDMVRSVGWVWE